MSYRYNDPIDHALPMVGIAVFVVVVFFAMVVSMVAGLLWLAGSL